MRASIVLNEIFIIISGMSRYQWHGALIYLLRRSAAFNAFEDKARSLKLAETESGGNLIEVDFFLILYFLCCVHCGVTQNMRS